jgi:hypothetical protein
MIIVVFRKFTIINLKIKIPQIGKKRRNAPYIIPLATQKSIGEKHFPHFMVISAFFGLIIC